MEPIQVSLILTTIALMLIGLFGTILPFFPGLSLIWAGIFFYSVITKFKVVDLNFILLISILYFSTVLIDYTANLWGARKFKASLWGITGALIGGIAGTMFGTFSAVILGAIAGAITGEVFSGRGQIFEIKTKTFIIIGFVGEILAKVTIGIIMIGLFIWKIS